MKRGMVDWIVTIKIRSPHGVEPYVRTLCGDTIAYRASEGEVASWTLKRKPKPVRRKP